MKIKLLIPVTLLFAMTAFGQTQAPAPDSPEVIKLRMDRMQNQLNDWPNLKRYRDKNTEVAAPAKETNFYSICKTTL